MVSTDGEIRIHELLTPPWLNKETNNKYEGLEGGRIFFFLPPCEFGQKKQQRAHFLFKNA